MLRIKGGKVYDPANGVNGEIKDICISDGRIVADVESGRTIDATGMVVFRDHRPGEVKCGPGDVGMDIDPAGEDHHAGRIDGAPAFDLFNDAAVRDADIPDLAVDPVGGVVDLPTRYPKHEVPIG